MTLRRGGPLTRHVPLRSGSALGRAATPSRPARRTGPASAVVELCLARAQYGCEFCGEMMGDRRSVDWSVHHRMPRRMGGTKSTGINRPSNLMIVCGSGSTGCHGVIESCRAASMAAGWLLRAGEDPLARPVVVDAWRRLVTLDDAGAYHDVRRPWSS